MVRLLHTADIHLGSQFPMLQSKAIEYRSQLLKTFGKIVDLAAAERVSLLLVAGDLFDSNRLYGITVGKVLSEFKKLEDLAIRVCIIPGTHDPWGKDSIFRSLTLSSNVTVFNPEYNQRTFEDIDVAVYGMVPETKNWDKSPFSGLSLNEQSKFHVGMAHCSIKIAGQENDKGTINNGEIAGSGLDYLALGHWHSFQDTSQGNTTACYAGSPEPIDMDQKGAGNVVIVTLKENEKTELRPIFIGTKKCDSTTIDIGPYESIDAIARLIEIKADPNLILEVVLTGLNKIDFNVNTNEIEEILREHFYHLRITDRTHPALETVKMENFTDKTVTGRYIGIMKEKIATASSEQERSSYEEALKLGFALLQGHIQVLE